MTRLCAFEDAAYRERSRRTPVGAAPEKKTVFVHGRKCLSESEGARKNASGENKKSTDSSWIRERKRISLFIAARRKKVRSGKPGRGKKGKD